MLKILFNFQINLNVKDVNLNIKRINFHDIMQMKVELNFQLINNLPLFIIFFDAKFRLQCCEQAKGETLMRNLDSQ